jgi:hypothetical protein
MMGIQMLPEQVLEGLEVFEDLETESKLCIRVFSRMTVEDFEVRRSSPSNIQMTWLKGVCCAVHRISPRKR